MTEKKIAISEIFGPTIAGEGLKAGQRTHFIRVGHCDGGGQKWCDWCDTMFSVDPIYKDDWKLMTPAEIVSQVNHRNALGRAIWVNISGGNPLLYDNELMAELLSLLHRAGYAVAVETQGTIYRPWIKHLDLVTVSPKAPSAGSTFTPEMWTELLKFTDDLDENENLCVKIAIDGDSAADLDFAVEVRNRTRISTLYLSLVTWPSKPFDLSLMAERYGKLIEAALKRPALVHATILPQLHAVAWGQERGR